MEASQAYVLGGNVPGSPGELLPDIQHLRTYFRDLLAGHDDSVARAYLLLAEIEGFKSGYDINNSHVHSRLFMDSAETFSHKLLADHCGIQVMSSTVEGAASKRMERYRHLIQMLAAKRAMQADMAEMIIQSGPISAKKTFTRMKGIVSSANFLYPEGELGLWHLGFRAMVTEHAILDSAREGWPTSHYSEPYEDAHGVDVFVGSDEAEAEEPLQVKYDGRLDGGLFKKETADRRPIIIVAGTDFEREPFRFDKRRIKKLLEIVRTTRQNRRSP